MAKVELKNIIDRGLMNIKSEHMTYCAKALSEKYGFDFDDAIRFLDLNNSSLDKKQATNKKPTEQPSKQKVDIPDDKELKKAALKMYAKTIREDVRLELTQSLDEDEVVKTEDVNKIIKQKWKDLDDSVKMEWIEKAKHVNVSE